ncbi:MAG: class I SAM-dependent methyltransferase [Thermoanaerobaculia bacterium]|nr:class I SAM-dependent methyltransferase [Thermoanaerobaculia bacterium]
MLERYRTASYFAGPGAGYSNYEAQEATLRRTFRSFLRELDRRGSLHGRLLEVGCAYGYFLEEARRYFSVRVGTDFSPEALAKAAPAADRVVLGGLADLRPGELFEFAAVIHVIEHIYEPVRFLEELRLRLVPGGRVLVATPDFGSLWRHLLGRRWPFFKVPEHVAFFDRATLPALLRRAGFEAPVPLAYPSLFPLGLVAEKVGLRLGGSAARLAGLDPRDLDRVQRPQPGRPASLTTAAPPFARRASAGRGRRGACRGCRAAGGRARPGSPPSAHPPRRPAGRASAPARAARRRRRSARSSARRTARAPGRRAAA